MTASRACPTLVDALRAAVGRAGDSRFERLEELMTAPITVFAPVPAIFTS